MTTKDLQPDIPGPEHSGKWIAWDDSDLHIVGCGTTLHDAEAQAVTLGVKEPTLEFVPPRNRYFVGRI